MIWQARKCLHCIGRRKRGTLIPREVGTVRRGASMTQLRARACLEKQAADLAQKTARLLCVHAVSSGSEVVGRGRGRGNKQGSCQARR